MQRLQEHGLCLKASKCVFTQPEVEFLGLVVSSTGTQMDPAKIAAITEWEPPTRLKGVHSFLGLANFYRRFIPGFATIIKPLTVLTKKDQPFVWDESQQTTFDFLKRQFTLAMILRYPDSTLLLRVEMDVSSFAIGAALMVKTNEGWNPAAYISHSLSRAELNWSVGDKELYAIMKAFTSWRHWLLPATHEIEVWCGHQNLSFFRKPQVLTARQSRWYTTLQEYNYRTIHKPGTQNGRADALSRKEELKADEEASEEICLLRRVVVRENSHPRILTWCYDSPGAGHFGAKKTYARLREHYYWTGMKRDSKEFVKHCSVCSQTKHRTGPLPGLSHPLPISEVPWHEVSMDLVTGLPNVDGFNAVCTVVDRFSKEIVVFPTTDSVDAPQLARLFRD